MKGFDLAKTGARGVARGRQPRIQWNS